MVNESFCTYQGKREEMLVSYLYDEINVEDRATFGRHLATCARCRIELHALGGVRDELGHWSPPEPADIGVINQPLALSPRRRLGGVMRDIPVWAQAAAAMLFLGAAAGLANLEVSYTAAGLTVHTGWRHPAGGAAAATVATSLPATMPWREDLTALEERLRSVLESETRAVAQRDRTSSDDEAIALQRVNALIQASERRQQRELALRVADVMRDVQSQRQVDLGKIEHQLGIIQSRTGMEVMRTQRQVNSLAQQVSQRP